MMTFEKPFIEPKLHQLLSRSTNVAPFRQSGTSQGIGRPISSRIGQS
jgi:hypothetical protein